MNIQKAIAFVRKNSAEIEQARLDHLLKIEKNEAIPLTYLRRLQNEDGGFPYGNVKGRVSSINSTAASLSLMIELGLTKNEVCKKTLGYLSHQQSKDGSWDEDEFVNEYNPPFWNTPGDLKTKMWLTATIVNSLIQLGYRESKSVRKAVKFLLSNRDDQGRFFGYLHSTWLSIAVFGLLEGYESEVVNKALQIMNLNLNRIENDPSALAWCLECFHAARIPKDNSLIKKCIERLGELQNQDGSWKTDEGEEYTISTTLNVLKALRMHEVW